MRRVIWVRCVRLLEGSRYDILQAQFEGEVNEGKRVT